ncbi:ion transporter [Xanthomarina sp.]|uniref:ion transporter n=1 Tax=Xanthomarina sp. TaxID=1931211 RepID=UPI002BF2F83B|nr:ion transporter [Xanthomarina sp.]HLV39189.1 ion transporter [Xanthomarina sp.]
MAEKKPLADWKIKVHDIIYEAETPAGKLFDIILLIAIVASILLVMLESVESLDKQYHTFFNISEWVITIMFSIEYILRIISVKRPLRYVTSFYGIIDLLSTIPKYLSLIFVGTHALVAFRAIRLLRVFRILKLVRFLSASNHLATALKASRAKIMVFVLAMVITTIILGTVMYLVEGKENGFDNIPKSVYWCIVTLTTVGFGDITPQTPLGQVIASFVMIMGYGIIAVPTGIVTAEYAKHDKGTDSNNHNANAISPIPKHPRNTDSNSLSCPNCLNENHKDSAKFCHECGHDLNTIS